MVSQNSKCASCGEKYHYCRSCDLPDPFYEKFCSYECWTKSSEYIDFINRATVFYYSLDEKQAEIFEELLDFGNAELLEEFKNRVGI